VLVKLIAVIDVLRHVVTVIVAERVFFRADFD
jgi:hypothetical protein